MSTTPPLRQAKIAVILLLLRNNQISLYQSSNFVLSLSNYPGSGTILFSITAYSLLFVVASTSATDIALSDCSVVSSEVLFIICKDPSYSNNISMSFILLELVLVLLCSLLHMCFIYHLVVTLPNFVHELTTMYLSFCKVSLMTLYQML